ncbi:hypothetical protein SEENIN0B_00272 [Salmonella enterica subsp. enterica serovar Infantis str. SARB27]|uniref:Uncharacterized protein n=1 Tax=Salmonella enterica subsp. enterica serovar Infantis str. SARB27 TaxID=596155 RepID=A0A6C8G539_SALIN|nr:hypothetical protein SEENIN0B_00272 [Salmonella enterica subsp. enterica serovar Infantis str. SARB27]
MTSKNYQNVSFFDLNHAKRASGCCNIVSLFISLIKSISSVT